MASTNTEKVVQEVLRHQALVSAWLERKRTIIFWLESSRTARFIICSWSNFSKQWGTSAKKTLRNVRAVLHSPPYNIPQILELVSSGYERLSLKDIRASVAVFMIMMYLEAQEHMWWSALQFKMSYEPLIELVEDVMSNTKERNELISQDPHTQKSKVFKNWMKALHNLRALWFYDISPGMRNSTIYLLRTARAAFEEWGYRDTRPTRVWTTVQEPMQSFQMLVAKSQFCYLMKM